MDGSFLGQIPSTPPGHVRLPGTTQGAGNGLHSVGCNINSDFEMSGPGVDFRPARAVTRRAARWGGFCAENVTATRHEALQSEYCGPAHLLIAYEQAGREHGESVVDEIARSTRRDLTSKLTYVPPWRCFRESYAPRILMRATFVYLDDSLIASAAGSNHGTPRLFFDSPVLWQTALKLAGLIEAGPSTNPLYGEALGVVLAHELLSLNGGAPATAPPARGGLAGWQRKLVAQHVEDNLAERISLAELADMARLSVYHFSRAFKQSFGLPPHRYHMARRIERAKTLLVNPHLSITEIAVDLGFGETSAFSATFRKFAGRTPTTYRRSLV